MNTGDENLGKESVGMQIKKSEDANAVKVCDAIKKEIGSLESQYKSYNLKFTIPQDGSEIIRDAARSVATDLVLAILLVSAIMLLFLHSTRNAFIVMISVPLSLIAAFIAMKLWGYTLNLMTLLAMSLVIGTLVDDAIVVLENIYRHLEMGKNRIQATFDGVREIGLSVVSITLVLVVVFLPVALSESLISPVLEPFAMVIVITVILSLFVSFTVVPLLTSRYAKLETLNTKHIGGFIINIFEKIVG